MPFIGEHSTDVYPEQGLLGGVTELEPTDRPQFDAGGTRIRHDVRHTAHQLFDQHMFFERVEDLPVIIQPQIGPLIRGIGSSTRIGTTNRSVSSRWSRSAITPKAVVFPTPPGPQSRTWVASACSSTHKES